MVSESGTSVRSACVALSRSDLSFGFIASAVLTQLIVSSASIAIDGASRQPQPPTYPSLSQSHGCPTLPGSDAQPSPRLAGAVRRLPGGGAGPIPDSTSQIQETSRPSWIPRLQPSPAVPGLQPCGAARD